MRERPLDAETVFARLEELRELLRLTDHLAGFRRAPCSRPEEPKGSDRMGERSR